MLCIAFTFIYFMLFDDVHWGVAILGSIVIGGLIAMVTMLVGALFLYMFFVPIMAIYGVWAAIHGWFQTKHKVHRH